MNEGYGLKETVEKNLEKEIMVVEKLLSENVLESQRLLEEYKIVKVPLVDSVKEQYNISVKENFYLEKTLKNLKKSLKHLSRINKTN